MANQAVKNPEIELEQINRDDLKDIETLSPDMERPISDKIATFLEKSGNQPYAHTNEGYVVVVKMTGDVDATDVLSDYLRKRTELMY